MPHPMQPIYKDDRGIVRFRANAIIEQLVRGGTIDLNRVAIMAQASPDITQDDIDQFWQLIGYSVSGYGDVGLVSQEAIQRADEAVEVLQERKRYGHIA